MILSFLCQDQDVLLIMFLNCNIYRDALQSKYWPKACILQLGILIQFCKILKSSKEDDFLDPIEKQTLCSVASRFHCQVSFSFSFGQFHSLKSNLVSFDQNCDLLKASYYQEVGFQRISCHQGYLEPANSST